MRDFLDILRQERPVRLNDLPVDGQRAPWMSDEHYRDHLLIVARGYSGDAMRALCVSNPLTKAALQLYHLGPSAFTPADLRRPSSSEPILWGEGWQILVPRPDSAALN